MTDWNNLKPPVAPVDGWGVTAQPTKSVWDAFDYGRFAGLTGQAAVDAGKFDEEDSAWSRGENVFLKEAAPITNWPREGANYSQLTEAIWTANSLNSAQTKAAVVNSLAGKKDEFNIDQDGELTRMNEIATGEQPIGYYIAYSNGKWLHAILSGPYDNAFALDAWGDECYDKLTNDAAFKLAFGNEFDRSGIYLAQIPLSAKRHGAYGVLS